MAFLTASRKRDSRDYSDDDEDEDDGEFDRWLTKHPSKSQGITGPAYKPLWAGVIGLAIGYWAGRSKSVVQ